MNGLHRLQCGALNKILSAYDVVTAPLSDG